MTSKKKFSEHIDKHYINLVEKINNKIELSQGKPLISKESIKMAKDAIKEKENKEKNETKDGAVQLELQF
jgi:hypothetical protein